MIHRRHVVVDGQSITLYSKDGLTWFMRPVDSLNHQRKRAAQREDIRRSFLRSHFELDDIDPIPVDEALSTRWPRR